VPVGRPGFAVIEYNPCVPRLTRYYGFNHAHFVTTSTYRRVRLFDPEPFRDLWVCTLGKVRDALRFKLMGYVLMPEHFHLLLWSGSQLNPSEIIRSLKVRTAMEILKFLREHQTRPWCRQTLNGLRLPPTVHSPATHRVWQRRFFDLNLWSASKILEKLNYMHGNPVKRGLVRLPEDWRWSSYRYYDSGDPAALTMDHLP
jgi:REP-associated tyrosine transposase